jgi:ribosomal protein S18 acetylase RimI-like enzyme
MTVRIRTFRQDDEPTLSDIVVEAFRGINIPYILEDQFSLPGLGAAGNIRTLRGLYTSEPENFLIAECDGKLAGFAGLSIDKNMQAGALMHIGVRPDMQGRGIGKALMDRMFGHFAENEVKAAWTGYDYQNQIAANLYHVKYGYTDLAVFHHYAREIHVGTDHRDDHVIEERVSKETLSKLLTDDAVELTLVDLLTKKHALNIDSKAIVLERIYRGSMNSPCVYQWTDSGITRGCVVGEFRPDPRVLMARHVFGPEEVVTSIVLQMCADLAASGTRVVDVFFNSGDDVTRRALRVSGFERVHSSVFVSKDI